MFYMLLAMGVLFGAIGFIVTEGNAKYILAGYNTLSEEERKKIDLKSFLGYFRKFHLFLGISLIIFGLFFTYVFNETIGLAFLVIYPCLAYIYFIIKSAKYSQGQTSKRKHKLAIYILVATLIFVVSVLGYGALENEISVSPDAIEIHGNYGEVLTPSEIERIALVHELPKIRFKSNGFALGKIKKGYFKTEDGERVKLILNSENKPYLLFVKDDGNKIYYAAKSESNAKLFEIIKETFPKLIGLP